jgi:nucleoside-diphosphate-sugar epimerase
MKKVLITGIDSFTGKHLSSYLQEVGYEVWGTSMVEDERPQVLRCDISVKEEIETVFDQVEVNFLIHLAGISFVGHGDSRDFYSVNSIATITILETLLNKCRKVEKVILASSATVYGNQGIEVLDESLCPKPANHYGASKYTMECLARNYFDKLPIIIARPFNYTGTGQAEHFLIPKIVKHFKERSAIIELGNLDVMREFNDIGFVCEVYRRLLECDIQSEVVNIASNRGIKLLDVIESMNRMAGYEIRVEVNPDFVRKDEIKSLTGSQKRLFEVIGEVEHIAFDKTLASMLASE